MHDSIVNRAWQTNQADSDGSHPQQLRGFVEWLNVAAADQWDTATSSDLQRASGPNHDAVACRVVYASCFRTRAEAGPSMAGVGEG